MKDHVSQHYVPKCYLRQFGFGEDAIWVYNKKKSSEKCYHTGIGAICQEDNYYDIEDKMLIDGMDKKFVEKEFFAQNIEKEFDKLLKVLSNDVEEVLSLGVKNGVILKEQSSRRLIAKHLIIQYLRHPDMRNYFAESLNSIPQLMNHIIKMSGQKAPSNITFDANEISSTVHWSHGFGSIEKVSLFIDKIIKNNWIFYISPKGEFHTCDHPVNVLLNCGNVNNECLGLNNYGSTVSFPLTSKLFLTIWDRRYFSHLSSFDGHVFFADENIIREEQELQYAYALSSVFANNNKFEIAKEMFTKNGQETYIHYSNHVEVITHT